MSSPIRASFPSSTTKDRIVVEGEENVSPPKPPRSAFICFSDAKKKEQSGQATHSDLLKYVAEQWRSLTDQQRAFWDEEARNDKLRYVREKAEYKGPWNIPKRRAKKHPLAPKRPMSAFLKYSQKRRTRVKQENPDMSNTDVSRLLGEMWRNATPAERSPYVQEEERERAQYKQDIAAWRGEQARQHEARRQPHHSVAIIPQEMDDPDLYEPLVVAPIRGSIPEGVFRPHPYARTEEHREMYHPAPTERYGPPQPYYGHYYPYHYQDHASYSSENGAHPAGDYTSPSGQERLHSKYFS